MKNSLSDSQYKKIFFITAYAIGLCVILYVLRTVLTPFLLSFCLAYFLNPAVDKIEEWRIPRTAGISLLIVCAITGTVILSLLLFPLIKVQIEEVVGNIPHYVSLVKSWIAPVIDTLAREHAQAVESAIESGVQDLGAIPLTLLSSVSSYVWGTVSSVASFIAACLSLLVVPIAAFYMLRDIDGIKEQCILFLPSQYKEEIMTIGKEIHGILKKVVRGQLTVSLILSVLYSAGLYFCGTPLWLVIGIIAGFANIVPFLGLIVGMLPAVIITFLHYHDWQHTVGTVIVFAVVQTLEGTVITPKIIGDTLGLHPLAIIAAVFVGGSIFGFFGVLLAVPAAAVLNVCLRRVFPACKKKQ